MKKFVLASTLLSISSASYAEPMEKCNVKMINAATYELANSKNRLVYDVKFVRQEQGAWTEMTGDNLGSGQVALTFHSKVFYFDVGAKQIGSTDDCKVTSVEEVSADQIEKRIVESEKLKILIGNANYMSETDSTWEVFYSDVVVSKLNQADIRTALRAEDENVEFYSKKDTLSMLDSYIQENPYESSDEAEKYKALKQALEKYSDIRSVKVGEPDSGTLYLYILVKSSEGYIIGLKTEVAET